MSRVLTLLIFGLILVAVAAALTEVQCSRWARRRPAAALLLCVVVFVGGCVSGAFVLSAFRARP